MKFEQERPVQRSMVARDTDIIRSPIPRDRDVGRAGNARQQVET